MPALKKFSLSLIPLAFFLAVIYFTPPPISWEQASNAQILFFFLPLLLFLMLFINIFFSYLPHSFIGSLGLIMLLAFQGSHLLTPISAVIIIVVTLIFMRLFPKLRYPRFKWHLTTSSKIPNISKLEGHKK
jgi:hypothetical protein